jgi:hypothetical protein
MERIAPLTLVADGADILRGTAIGVITLVVLLAALVGLGFVLLFRRHGDNGIPLSNDSGLGALRVRSGSLLVRLDDALRDADHEIGFALAQFGAEKARPYADALASARAKVAEAFRLKQRLDDATPDSERRQREWTLQIIALCEQAEALLTEQDAAFNELRGLEVDAAATLADVRSRIAAATDRVDAARKTLTGLAKKYVASTFAPVAKNPDEAERLLETATTTADAARVRCTTLPAPHSAPTSCSPRSTPSRTTSAERTMPSKHSAPKPRPISKRRKPSAMALPTPTLVERSSARLPRSKPISPRSARAPQTRLPNSTTSGRL